MKTKLIAIILATASLGAFASDRQQFTGLVQSSDCILVSSSGSTAGAMIGGGVGTAAGAAIGGALFGKTGRLLGGLAGGAGGAIAGEKVGSNDTYAYLVQVKSPSGEILNSKVTTTSRIVQGESVKVVKAGNEVLVSK